MNAPAAQPAGGAKEIYRQRQLDAIAARWDQRAAQWDRALEDPACHLNEDDAYHRFLGAAHRIIDSRREFCAQHGLIDAGCGTGLVLAEAGPAFAWGIGVDLSREMIRLAAVKAIAKARFLVGDCFQLAQLCSPAAAVFSRGVLLSHYGPSQGQGLLESARAVLVPGGFVLFDFLNAEGRTRHAHQPADKAYYTGPQAAALAQGAGFAKVTICGEPERRVLLLLAHSTAH